MKLGVCTSVSRLDKALLMGGDYVELGASEIYGLSEDEYEALCAKIKNENIKTYSCNGLVISDLRLTGDDVDFDKIKDYTEKLFYRLDKLGIKMLVFGSGRAKHVPDGFPMEKAWEQLFEVGRIFSDCAAKYSQTIAVEALSYNEVNIVNTIDDAAYYIKNVNRDNFKSLVDFYHVNNNKESLDVLDKYADIIVHAHIANPARVFPTDEDDAFIGERLLRLKKNGYNGCVSFECGMPEDANVVKKGIEKYKKMIG